jgi:DNA-binding beta-propeller fold protein YncE
MHGCRGRMTRSISRVLATTLLLTVVSACSQESGHGHVRPAAVGCSGRVDTGRPLAGTSLRTFDLPDPPFSVVALPGGQLLVAALTVHTDLGDHGELAVLAVHGRGARPIRLVALPPPVGGGSGMALTHDGRLLLVAAETATAVVSVTKLRDGAHHPVVGILHDGELGQYEVAVSADDRYAFVADENSGGLSVFNLALALRNGFSAAGVAVGMIHLGRGAVGVAAAPGGSRVYVTTLGGYGPLGQLWVIDARRAEHRADRAAVIAHVRAGCQPTRVAVSPDGKTLWVTALQSNALLGYSTTVLERDPARALRAVVRVGSQPVGMLLLDHGRAAVVADSNRFSQIPGAAGKAASSRISVVSTADALNGHRSVVGYLPAGLFPRDLGYDPATREILIANYLSDTVELLHTPALP